MLKVFPSVIWYYRWFTHQLYLHYWKLSPWWSILLALSATWKNITRIIFWLTSLPRVDPLTILILRPYFFQNNDKFFILCFGVFLWLPHSGAKCCGWNLCIALMSFSKLVVTKVGEFSICLILLFIVYIIFLSLFLSLWDVLFLVVIAVW